MLDSGIPPTSHNVGGPSGPSGPNEPNSQGAATGPFAKMFPGASPEVVQKFTNGFINFTIQQMKQDQQNMLEAIKKMQDDQDQS